MKIRIYKKTIENFVAWCNKNNRPITNLVLDNETIIPGFEIIND